MRRARVSSIRSVLPGSRRRRSRTDAPRRRARALTVAVLVALAVPVPALAHVGVRASERSSPTTTVLSLSSRAETAFREVRGGTATADPADPYILRVTATTPEASVSLRVLSRDGHVSDIAIVDGRVRVSSRDSALAILGRWLALAGLVAIAGVVVVGRFVVLAGIRQPLAAFGERTPQAAVQTELAAGLERALPRAVAGFGAVAGVGGLLLIAGTLRRLHSGRVIHLASATTVGRAAGVIVVAGVVALIAGRVRGGAAPVALTVAAAASALALVGISLTGHATAGTDAVLSAAFDGVHMLATALWLGGLLALTLGVLRVRGTPTTGTLAAVVVRFSGLALVCVAVLAVTGTYRALAELSRLSDLLHTGYGRALLVKLIIFAGMLGVGAYNRFVLHPRLERAAIGLASDPRGAGNALRRSVRAELALAAAVLLVVAVMIGFPPP